ncbi:MAG: HDIG domain-containing protein [Pirellulales bacterium]|nr:HDIG domain-containing protein [Pirellulales bacterium]
MSSGPLRKLTRTSRLSSFELPPGLIEQTLDNVKRGDVLLRFVLCLAGAVILWLMVGGWKPPFPYRTEQVPLRNIIPRVDFRQLDQPATDRQREEARKQTPAIFQHQNTKFPQIRGELNNLLQLIATAETFDKLPEGLWEKFSLPPEMQMATPTPQEAVESFNRFREKLVPEKSFQEFEKAIQEAFAELERDGVLETSEKTKIPSRQDEIILKTPNVPQVVTVAEVLQQRARDKLLKRLQESPAIGTEAAQRLFHWLGPQIVGTLTYDDAATRAAQEKAALDVPPVYRQYKANDQERALALGGKPIGPEEFQLLREEYAAMVNSLTWEQKLYRSLANFGMFFALYTLSGFYIFFRERSLLTDFRRFVTLLALFIVAVGLCHLAATNDMRAEMVPLLVFGMTVGIAYHQELALLLTATLTLIVTFTLGQGLPEYVILSSAAATSILLLGRIRTRRKLIYVGAAAGLVAFFTSIGVGVLNHQPPSLGLLITGGKNALFTLIACFIVSGMLPFIEQVFSVLTDLSLLELGDPSHPLLQQLVQRAPGTYNHSINVAAIAEAAAEAIGCRGLLVRVGAYFHDIGKMIKPQYFVENQGREGNKHETLNPAMSTLVIIAHVKDGADLARQHHLPQPVIDFIQQHHGTTLVEFFFRRASQQSENDPDAADVDESSFRYPGPKPQTKEIGILMLADAAESASRTLVDPTPARLEGLVHDLAMKRLLDGQFDECGLTLRELASVEESLVKSLTAVFHGRVKYQDQRTA